MYTHISSYHLFLCSSQAISHSSEFFLQFHRLIRHGRLQSLSLDHLHLELSEMKLGKAEVIYCRNTPFSEKTMSLCKPGLWTGPWTEILNSFMCTEVYSYHKPLPGMFILTSCNFCIWCYSNYSVHNLRDRDSIALNSEKNEAIQRMA